MARMISEGEKRAKRAKAIAAQRIQSLEGRGYSTEDAKTAVSAIQGATLLARAVALSRDLGVGNAADLSKTERLAVDEAAKAVAVVAKYEPKRAAFAERVLELARSRVES